MMMMSEEEEQEEDEDLEGFIDIVETNNPSFFHTINQQIQESEEIAVPQTTSVSGIIYHIKVAKYEYDYHVTDQTRWDTMFCYRKFQRIIWCSI